MVDRIKSSLAREAILSALADRAGAARSVQAEAQRVFDAALETGASARSGELARPSSSVEAAAARGASGLADGFKDGLAAIDREVRAAQPETLAGDLLSGRVSDFHEIAARVNRARISFEFALEIRNKLIDAYRETMRMSV